MANGCGGKKVEASGCGDVGSKDVLADASLSAFEKAFESAGNIDGGTLPPGGVTDQQAEILRLNEEIDRLLQELGQNDEHHSDLHAALEEADHIFYSLQEEIAELKAQNKDLNRVMCPIVRAFRAVKRFFGKKSDASCSVQG